VQVTDRYHLVSNLSDAVEKDAHQLQMQARHDLARGLRASRPSIEARRLRCRQARYERYLAVVECDRQGDTQLAIAAKLGLSAGTVAVWLHAPGFPERRIPSHRRRDQPRLLEDRASEGSSRLVRTHFSAGRVAALMVQGRRRLTALQRPYLQNFLRFCPMARELRSLIGRFRAILRLHRCDRLPAWIETATASGFPFVAQYAKTLRRDLGAVELAITTPWSNGPLEGQINRLKVIKQQMYGRAGFELLRARVLPFEPLAA
jgi:hypothetical protein